MDLSVQRDSYPSPSNTCLQKWTRKKKKKKKKKKQKRKWKKIDKEKLFANLIADKEQVSRTTNPFRKSIKDMKGYST